MVFSLCHLYDNVVLYVRDDDIVMGKIQTHPPVKLFTAITYHASFDLNPLLLNLEKTFSAIEIRSEIYNFSEYTDYYQTEMGRELQKLFVVFSSLIDPETLSSIKIATNRMESELIRRKKRLVNIDPGYITQAKLILATTKNYSHRIYLGQGIFGDLHLQFSRGSYRSQPWTYPDYKSEKNIQFFNMVRKKYLEQLGSQL